jgi:ubiquinone/menaquinone biosynthesis C-methylase UbiE
VGDLRDTGENAAAAVVFDRAAEYYDRTRGYPEGVGESVADLLCTAGGLGPASRVLEVGVGTGRIALPLAARVWRVLGIDLSRAMLTRLATKPGSERVACVIADATALPFRDACLDAVVGVHVFHLIPAWQRALAEVRRVLAPNGVYLEAADRQLLPELWEDAYEGVAKPQNVGVAHGAVEFPVAYGFRALGSTLTLRFAVEVSLAEFLEQLQARVWSATWRMSDEQHAQVVSNMRRAIVRRYGRAERVLSLEREVSVRAFTAE